LAAFAKSEADIGFVCSNQPPATTTMSDNATPTPSPVPAPEPKPDDKPTRSRGYFNKSQLEDLVTAETVLAAARKNAAALVKRRVDDKYLKGLEDAIKEARRRLTDAGQSVDAAQAANLKATGKERVLVIALQGIQSAAKQLHKMLAEDDDATTNFPLDGYLIGERLNVSRADLLQNAEALIAKATADKLPGYDDPADIKAVQDALIAYRGSETESDNADSDQVSDTTSRDKLMKTINTRRSATQHAADAIWPYTDEANAGQRKAFELPQNRPLGV